MDDENADIKAEIERDELRELQREKDELPMREWIKDNEQSLADEFIEHQKHLNEFYKHLHDIKAEYSKYEALEFCKDDYADDFNEWCEECYNELE